MLYRGFSLRLHARSLMVACPQSHSCAMRVCVYPSAVNSPIILDQSMHGSLSVNRFCAIGHPINGCPIVGFVTKKERTPFGERLHQARKHAGLTQPQLSKAVGMAQSTLGELEYVGHGSTFTTKIAMRCGVRAEWLAEGHGPMLDEVQRLDPEVLRAAEQINALPDKLRRWALTVIEHTLEIALEPPTGNDVGDMPNSETEATKVRKTA